MWGSLITLGAPETNGDQLQRGDQRVREGRAVGAGLGFVAGDASLLVEAERHQRHNGDTSLCYAGRPDLVARPDGAAPSRGRAGPVARTEGGPAGSA